MLDNNLFSILGWPKTWLQNTYEIDFDMIFRFMAAQHLVAEHYESYFDMILHFKTAQNFVAEQ